MAHHRPLLSHLRAQLDAACPPAVALTGGARLGFGCPLLDDRLNGGLPAAALHEIVPDTADDASSAAGAALLLGARRDGAGRTTPILWLRNLARRRGAYGALYAPGLAELGIDPARLLIIEAPDTLAQLRAAADIARCRAAPVLIIDLGGAAPALDLTASRRLMLAARDSGASIVVLRGPGPSAPTAAFSRWRVASAASTPMAANAPGRPAFTLMLDRHRGGIAPFALTLEWNRDHHRFTLPATILTIGAALARAPTLSSAVSSVARGRGVGPALAGVWRHAA